MRWDGWWEMIWMVGDGVEGDDGFEGKLKKGRDMCGIKREKFALTNMEGPDKGDDKSHHVGR